MSNPLSSIAKKLDNAAMEAKSIPQISQDQSMTIEEAYEVQKLSIGRRLNRGENLTGYKLGFTSKAKMEQMGVHELIWGRLTDQMDLTIEKVLSIKKYIHPRVEPEVAFIIGKDITEALTIDNVYEFIEFVAPALEVIDSRYENFKFSLEDVIADNCSSTAYVIGDFLPPNTKINDVYLSMNINGECAQDGNTNAILGDPIESFLEATRIAVKYNVPLLKGMVILAGAATPAEYLKVGDAVKCDFGSLGVVTLNVI